MRWLAAALALLLAVPATAQDKPEWVGVWEGNVGNYPVRLCMDVWGDGAGRGSYYYLSQLEPIALSEEDSEGGWIERFGNSEALWEFTEQNGERLRGTWRQGRRSLAFDLRPVSWTEGEWGGPCSSEAFLGPRLAGGEVVFAAVLKFGRDPTTSFNYEERTYNPPAHLAGDVSIQAFAIPEEQPGDAAINALVRAALPQGGIGDDVYDCLAGAIASLGTDGYFEHDLTPVMMTREFLAVEESSGSFCGGAHPNHWTVIRTFDRQSGEEVDLFDWIGEARVDGEDSVIADAVRALIVARWASDETECSELAEQTDYWSIGLAREGLVFRPDFPQVATACEAPITVEWDALAPFLDAEGRAGLARLREP